MPVPKLALLAVLALPGLAHAARSGTPSGLTGAAASTHFVVHHHESGADAITATQAAHLRDQLEQAYAVEVAPGPLGFPAPIDDGDGRVDVYVDTATLAAAGGDVESGAVPDDQSAATTSGWIVLTRRAAVDDATSGLTLAHELFHLLQAAVGRETSSGGAPVVEATAEWAAAQATGLLPRPPQYAYDAGAPLDCPGKTCEPSGLEGYGQWPFFQLLSERYGKTIVREIYAQEQSLGPGHMLDAIDAALLGKGSSLEQAFGDWTNAILGKTYEFAPLNEQDVHPDATIESAELAGGETVARTLVADHLASRFVVIGSAACPVETRRFLHLLVMLPAGSRGRPAFAAYRSAGVGPVHAFDVAGDSATLDVGFTPCAELGIVALPNPSRTADGAGFVLRATLHRSPPPPRITAIVPRSLRLTSRHAVLRFRVTASGPGRLLAVLHSRPLARRFVLRTGVNRLRMPVPADLGAGRHRLTLTSRSRDGRRGDAVRATITVRRP